MHEHLYEGLQGCILQSWLCAGQGWPCLLGFVISSARGRCPGLCLCMCIRWGDEKLIAPGVSAQAGSASACKHACCPVLEGPSAESAGNLLMLLWLCCLLGHIAGRTHQGCRQMCLMACAVCSLRSEVDDNVMAAAQAASCGS